MAYAAPRVGHITGTARNHVQVQVRDGLSGCLAAVDPEVESIGRIMPQDEITDERDGIGDRGLLGRCGIEPGSHMTMRHDEGVARCDRKAIPQRTYQRQTQKHPTRLRAAEGAVLDAMGRRVSYSGMGHALRSPFGRPVGYLTIQGAQGVRRRAHRIKCAQQDDRYPQLKENPS